MTYDEAMKILAILKGAYPNSYKGITPKEAKLTGVVWASQFVDVPVNAMIMAVNKCISKCTFPPSIKEVKDELRGIFGECEMLMILHRQALRDKEQYGQSPHELTGQMLKDVEAIYKALENYRHDDAPRVADMVQNLGQYSLASTEEKNRIE